MRYEAPADFFLHAVSLVAQTSVLLTSRFPRISQHHFGLRDRSGAGAVRRKMFIV